MNEENIFEGFEPVIPTQTVAELPDLTYIKALVIPYPKVGKGRKSYDVSCIIRKDGITENVVISMNESQRAAFENNPYQQKNDGALVALIRKA